MGTQTALKDADGFKQEYDNQVMMKSAGYEYIQDNFQKEDHPRFQRAKDATRSQTDQQKDEYKRMSDEELTKATEQYLKDNPDSDQEVEVTRASEKKVTIRS